MIRQVYISADYSEDDGDRAVVNELKKWGSDNLHKVDFIDMADPYYSVSDSSDCRPCDLKLEFNRLINASGAVIFVVGNKTADREAGNSCLRNENEWENCYCTPYKQNASGTVKCKVIGPIFPDTYNLDVGEINRYSYLRHEFEQAQKLGKRIIIVYNSSQNETGWLPAYMERYKSIAVPFWLINDRGERIGNYEYIKKVLGYGG